MRCISALFLTLGIITANLVADEIPKPALPADKGWNSFHFWGSKSYPRRIASVEQDYRPPNELNRLFEFPESGVFKVIRSAKGVSLYIDEKPVYENIKLPVNDENSHPHIGFGSRQPAAGMVLEVSDVEVRTVGDEI